MIYLAATLFIMLIVIYVFSKSFGIKILDTKIVVI